MLTGLRESLSSFTATWCASKGVSVRHWTEFRVLGATRIQAETPGAEGGDLQQPARHGRVLEEVDELVLVAQLIVERERGGHAEDGKPGCYQTCAISQDQGDATDRFNQNGNRQWQRGEWQADRFDVADHASRRAELTDARGQNTGTQQNTAC